FIPPPPMTPLPARGKILRIEGDYAVFNPAGTTYEIHLLYPKGKAPTPSDRQTSVVIRATARKVWTVPSGGNFVTPIFGPPKIAQGRTKDLSDRQMILHAGVPIVVTLPTSEDAYDLQKGPLTVPGLVNCTLMPGATIEVVEEPVSASPL
ncbi:MAG TPA: hypothetical protein VK986_00095, partial [Tepidisphaeraceae bacterium]|nr:hypothetical protein [Tepidisphaeraceae bacterium]